MIVFESSFNSPLLSTHHVLDTLGCLGLAPWLHTELGRRALLTTKAGAAVATRQQLGTALVTGQPGGGGHRTVGYKRLGNYNPKKKPCNDDAYGVMVVEL